jgi:ATP-dependent helicase/nuclease subunit A
MSFAGIAPHRLASDPDFSVWVSASAGSGKTKALTDRVLRLLLRGVCPSRILCITFTKAAAEEMIGRALAKLSSYLLMDDAALKAELASYGDDAVLAADTERIRRLAMELEEGETGLHIRTIHAFCRSLLQQFAQEAGYAPGLRFIEERESRRMMDDAKRRVFGGLDGASPALKEAFTALLRRLGSEDTLDGLLGELLSKWHVLDMDGFGSEAGFAEAEERLAAYLEIPPGTDGASVLHDVIFPPDPDALLSAADALYADSAKTMQAAGAAMRAFLACPEEEREGRLSDYVSCFLTKEGEKRKRAVTAGIEKGFPEVAARMAQEQDRLLAALKVRDAVLIRERTLALWRVAAEILREYHAIKRRENAVDFQDMIVHAGRLLKEGGEALSVLYALDRRIHHILLDEAQDTSPEQWDIVAALTEDYLSGFSAGDEDGGRSLFVVGDEKQSIYRFQGADPDNFRKMRGYFRARHAEAERPFREVALDRSFRSVPAILEATDCVFASPGTGGRIASGPVGHESARAGLPGRVLVYPLSGQGADEKERGEEWHIPEGYPQRRDANAALAEDIANAIDVMLAERKATASRPHGIAASDMLVLVRKRRPLADLVRAACLRRGIKTAGADRFAPSEHILVKDMLAFASVSLDPHDDYHLAALLRSPFFGINDADLDALCIGRGEKSVMERLEERPSLSAFLAKLRRYAEAARRLPAKAFFEYMIYDDLHLPRMEERWGEEASAVAGRLLATADAFGQEGLCTLRHFLARMRRDKESVKRDLGSEEEGVRVMTVHGAKGLQAPVVILADTTGLPHGRYPVLWTDTRPPMPLWPGALKTERTRALVERERDQALSEYFRLLYVAMTRAQDELHAFGAALPGRAPSPDCWHARMASAVREIGAEDENGVLVYGQAFGAARGAAPLPQREEVGQNLLPAFLRQRAFAFEIVRPCAKEEGALSPSERAALHYRAEGEGSEGAKRGETAHRLIELLCAALGNPEESEERAIRRLCRALRDESLRADMERMLLGLMRREETASLLRSRPLTEVPVVGAIGGRRVSGRIDMLSVEEGRVRIVDVKTGRPPEAGGEARAAYAEQLRLYAELIRQSFPGRRIETALLWADAAWLEAGEVFL